MKWVSPPTHFQGRGDGRWREVIASCRKFGYNVGRWDAFAALATEVLKSPDDEPGVCANVCLVTRMVLRTFPRGLDYIAKHEQKAGSTPIDLMAVRQAFVSRLVLMRTCTADVHVVAKVMECFTSMLAEYGFPKYVIDVDMFANDLVTGHMVEEVEHLEADKEAERIRAEAATQLNVDKEQERMELKRKADEVDTLKAQLSIMTQKIAKAATTGEKISPIRVHPANAVALPRPSTSEDEDNLL